MQSKMGPEKPDLAQTKKKIPSHIPGAVRITCPNCGRIFNYHLHYGMATNICARCHHVFLTKYEHSVVDLSIPAEEIEADNQEMAA